MKQLIIALCLACAPPLAAAELAIVGATIQPAPEAPAIVGGAVLVRDGEIVAVGAAGEVEVPAGATVIDGEGGFLTAGFWNSHVHFLSPALRAPATRPAPELEAAVREALTSRGFTTVFDISSFHGDAAAMRARIESGEVAGPEVLYVDAPFFPEGGTPVYVRDLLERIGAPSAEVADPAQARERARRQLAAGADGVKLFAGAIVEAGVVPMDVAIARAVVEEAHAAGKPAFAHPTDLAGLEVAMASGVDVLAHTTPSMGAWDAALVERMRAAGLALVPTLTLFEVELRRERAPDEVRERVLDAAARQLGAFAAAGGTVLFGTDVGYIDHLDTRREFELMARAGLDWRQILDSLTTAPAARFGQGGRKGRIAPGMRADLVLLRADPRADVRGFAEVRATIRAGELIYAAAAAPGGGAEASVR
ncbi:amidohydrolase family protein [Luteimonas sp. RD2P54]|uniref:Amidohydrolase family protein n=1 Tax=Luteimonas endophytica TaxID=3042023 RepID=A0ABT6JA64_9GAMM|nr:amidohydrolase family protein [Luteimonas endophytica]MDH5823713.1 amidohydrolase family protein [Luteimonas endophytica]